MYVTLWPPLFLLLYKTYFMNSSLNRPIFYLWIYFWIEFEFDKLSLENKLVSLNPQNFYVKFPCHEVSKHDVSCDSSLKTLKWTSIPSSPSFKSFSQSYIILILALVIDIVVKWELSLNFRTPRALNCI